MDDPRQYTDAESCVQPMERGDIIVGYRRVDVGMLLRHARKERTVVDLSLYPFGLRVRHGVTPVLAPAEMQPTSMVCSMIARLVEQHPTLTAHRTAVRAICGQLQEQGGTGEGYISYCERTRVVRMTVPGSTTTPAIAMARLQQMVSTPDTSGVRFVSGNVPYIEFTVGGGRRAGARERYRWL